MNAKHNKDEQTTGQKEPNRRKTGKNEQKNPQQCKQTAKLTRIETSNNERNNSFTVNNTHTHKKVIDKRTQPPKHQRPSDRIQFE